MYGSMLIWEIACGYSASFNSWDRQSYFWETEDGVTHMKPEMNLIQRNLILNKDYQYGSANSDWAIGNDLPILT